MRSAGGPTWAGMISTSRPSSFSTAPSARSARSAAPEDYSSGPVSMPGYLAWAHGGARPVVSARPGSGRSRFAGHRRRIRLEARAQAWTPIRRHDSVRDSSPTSLWKLWKTPVVEPQAHAGLFKRAVRRLYDARPSLRSPERGRAGRNLGKSANFSQPLPRSAAASPFVRSALPALTTPPVSPGVSATNGEAAASARRWWRGPPHRKTRARRLLIRRQRRTGSSPARGGGPRLFRPFARNRR